MIIEEKPAVAAAKQRTHSGRPTSFRAWRAAAQKFIKLQEKKTSIKRSSYLYNANDVKKVYPYCFKNKKKITIVDSFLV